MSLGRACVRRRCRWGLLALATVLAATTVAGTADARHRQHRHAAAESYDPAYASIVVDANSGAVMQSSNADSPRHPASLTKIMTLYLLFERLEAGKIKLSTEMPVSEHAAAQAPSKLGLKPGESIEVGTAIRAIVTKSANDVAVVVAEALAGNETEFAKLMTAKAHALGMNHTAYHNASGLPDDKQLTTARDQAILGRAIQDRFPKYYHYFSTQTFAYHGKEMRNHNHLLGRVAGVDGIKTGYIHESGFNIIASVRRNGRHLVAAVFGGRTASARDARVISLISNNINVAAAKRTAPLVVEGWETKVAHANAAKEAAKDKVAGAMPPPRPTSAPRASRAGRADAGLDRSDQAGAGEDRLCPAGHHAHGLAVAAAVGKPQAQPGAGDCQAGNRHKRRHRQTRDAAAAGQARPDCPACLRRHRCPGACRSPGARRQAARRLDDPGRRLRHRARGQGTPHRRADKCKRPARRSEPLYRAGRQGRQDALSRPLCRIGKVAGGNRLQEPQAQRNSMHAAQELRAKKRRRNGDAPNQEPLMVLRMEYLSDGGEEGLPWPR